MNRKRRHTFGMTIGLLIMLLIAAGVSAQEYPLGDVGMPEDYNQTMKLFSETEEDFDSFVEQLPTSFNWKTQGKVTVAKDQQSCGSCWAFASVGALESKLMMKGKAASDLSEQQQISCNTNMYGCSGGSMTALKFWETIGPMQESCTGYPSSGGSEPACSTLNCAKLGYRTMNYYTVNMASRDEIKASLYNDGPTYFRYNVYSDFQTFWNSAGSGAVYKQRTGSNLGGHAVLLIGWNDSKGAWLLKNSWGATDGPNGDGTFWMAYTGHAVDLGFGMANVDIKQLVPTPIPVLVAPSGTITDRTPTFKWKKVTGATQYRYQLYRGTTLVYTKTVPASACGTTYCTNTPTTNLNYSAHKWHARALVGGVWKPYSAYKNFTVSSSSGFNVTETQFIDSTTQGSCTGEVVAKVTLKSGANKLNVDFKMPAVDMDMNVEEPGGACAWYSNQNTVNGGRHGGDVLGNGTETYAIANGPAGVYTIRAHTHGSPANASSHIYGINGTVNLTATSAKVEFSDFSFDEGK